MNKRLAAAQALPKLSKKIYAFVQKQPWLEKYGYELLFFILRLAGFSGSLLLFAQDGLTFRISGIILLSYFYYAIGVTGTHETRHSSFAHSGRVNRCLAYFFSDFWSGQSNNWWFHRHVQIHHQHTNIKKIDETQFYSTSLGRVMYFFLLPLIITFWLSYHSIQFLQAKRKGLLAFVLLMLSGWTFHVGIFYLIVPLPKAVAAAIIMRGLFAPLFVHIALFNHIGLPEPRKKPRWYAHQTETTRNLKKHWLLTGLGGNAFIHCHIEHHLFPTLSNRMLEKIKPMVRKALRKSGYRYEEVGYWQFLKQSLRDYDRMFVRARKS